MVILYLKFNVATFVVKFHFPLESSITLLCSLQLLAVTREFLDDPNHEFEIVCDERDM